MHSELRIAQAAAPPELRIAGQSRPSELGIASKNPSILEKPMGFSRMTRFFVIRVIDFSAKMSGNLGFGRNPSLSNCPGLPFLLEGPPLTILEGPPVAHRYTGGPGP